MRHGEHRTDDSCEEHAACDDEVIDALAEEAHPDDEVLADDAEPVYFGPMDPRDDINAPLVFLGAAPPPPPLPPPAAPPVHVAALPRRRRVIPWGPFTISPVYKGAEQVAWGGNCNCHYNAIHNVHLKCCKQISGSGNESKRLIMKWLILGQDIHNDDFFDARDAHVLMRLNSIHHHRTMSCV